MGDLGAQLQQISEQLAQFSALVDARLKVLEQPQAALAAPGGSAAGGPLGGAGGAAAGGQSVEAELLQRYHSVCVALTGCLPDRPLEEYACDSSWDFHTGSPIQSADRRGCEAQESSTIC